ncbi:MAG: serine/threonine protein kinase, partial [Deltaproteobacteria bacterium]|nr:serine/threonine protein kinase [Kofleriaceae bacterium]
MNAATWRVAWAARTDHGWWSQPSLACREGDGDRPGMIGEVIGSYRIVSELGRGGIGVVYLAEHVSLGNRAVVKTLLPQYGEDKEALARFFNEAKAATAIRHPGIVTIFDYGHHAACDAAYIVMEHLQGEALAERIDRGPIAPMAAAAIARQTASVVGAAHRAGIVHRDLKPDNLFIVPDPDMPERERVKVLDFGIAKLADSTTAVKTQASSVMGTPIYMAPEQCQSAASVDGRADIYALGCILYEMLTGRPPFVGTTMAQLVTSHLFEAPVPPGQRVAGIPPELERTVLRALAKSPDQRHPDMAQLARELDAVIARSPVALPPEAPASATALDGGVNRPPTLATTLSRSVRSIEAPTASTHAPRRRGLVIAMAAAGMLVAGMATFV